MMAGDWIKMRTDLYRDPKVCVMADLLMDAESDLSHFVSQNCQRDITVTRNVMRNAVVGALVSVWGVFRLRGKRSGGDLVVRGATIAVIDDVADIPGFGDSMASVGWVDDAADGVVFSRFFDDYNVDPVADVKAKNAERQKRFRDRKKASESNDLSNVIVTQQSNLEKSREESKPKPPISPETAGKKKRVQRTPETPLPADFEVFEEMAEWAKSKGLTDPQIDAETERFIAHHQAKGTRWSDWEAAWRKWILNAIKFGLDVKPPLVQNAPANLELSLPSLEVRK